MAKIYDTEKRNRNVKKFWNRKKDMNIRKKQEQKL